MTRLLCRLLCWLSPHDGCSLFDAPTYEPDDDHALREMARMRGQVREGNVVIAEMLRGTYRPREEGR